jgi:hypothetical protein
MTTSMSMTKSVNNTSVIAWEYVGNVTPSQIVSVSLLGVSNSVSIGSFAGLLSGSTLSGSTATENINSFSVTETFAATGVQSTESVGNLIEVNSYVGVSNSMSSDVGSLSQSVSVILSGSSARGIASNFVNVVTPQSNQILTNINNVYASVNISLTNVSASGQIYYNLISRGSIPNTLTIDENHIMRGEPRSYKFNSVSRGYISEANTREYTYRK